MNQEQRALKERELRALLPTGATLLFDQPYIPGADRETAFDSNQTLDLYVPSGPGPFPLIVWIHGGGWFSSNKDIDFAPQALGRRFALASLDYRLTADGFPFPAQIEDCFSALAWLRQNGVNYRVDAERVGLIGHSAGSHLCGLIATAGRTNPFTAPSSFPRVQAAVLWSAPLDLGRERGNWPRSMFPWNPEDVFCKKFFAGGVYDEEFAKWASPFSYVRAGLPPMLIVHGGKDDIVPPGQAIAFAKAVEECGGEVKIRIEDERDHDILFPNNFAEAFAFFESTLNPNH